MNRGINNQRGFTLIELLVALAIGGFIMGVMVLMFNVINKISSSSISQNIELSQVQLAASWISRDVMSADNVTPYATGTRLAKIGRYLWNGTDDITTAYVYYDINSSNQLLRTVGSGSARIVAQFISGLGGSGTSIVSENISDNITYILTLKSVYNNSPAFSRVYRVTRRIH
jgi:prepilin-type N-terminal cleavage/methylation domain-containing protein